VELEPGRLRSIDFGCLVTSADLPLGDRLAAIHAKVVELIAEHRPTLIGVERLSDLTDSTDRGTAFIFADGAGAAVIGPSDTPSIGPVVWGSDGEQFDLIRQDEDWRDAIAEFLTAERDLAVTRAIVAKAGAVDGVTARRDATVDGFGPEIHGALIDELGRIAWGQAAD